MIAALTVTAPGLHLGRMQLTAYGLCAAVGMLLATTLSGRIAHRLGLTPEAAWDAGLFAVICCFVASRLLLILRDPVAFAHYPMVVLGLPSLTFGGMALAAFAVWLYLRAKRQPVLTMLDAFAPGGALLAAFLELGHTLDGSEPGMPLGSAAATATPATPTLLWPVAPAGMLLSMLLAVFLLWCLTRNPARGTVAALAISLGGLCAFALDLVSLPSDLFATLPLEPGQMVALAAVLAGVLVWVLGVHDRKLSAAALPENR